MWISCHISWDKTENRLKDGRNDQINIRVLMAGRFSNFQSCHSYTTVLSHLFLKTIISRSVPFWPSPWFPFIETYFLLSWVIDTSELDKNSLASGYRGSFNWFWFGRSGLTSRRRRAIQMVLQDVYLLS